MSRDAADGAPGDDGAHASGDRAETPWPSIPPPPDSMAPVSREASSGVVLSLFQGDAGPGYWIVEEGAAPVTMAIAGRAGRTWRVVRLSPTAIWFLPDRQSSPSMGEAVHVELAFRGRKLPPLAGQVVQLSAETSGPCVGVKLDAISIDAGRALLSFLAGLVSEGAAEPTSRATPVHEEVTCPKRVRAIMGALASVGNKGIVHGTGKLSRLRIERLDATAGRVEWALTAGAVDWGAPPHAIDIIGYNSIYRLEVESACVVDGRVVTPLPTRVTRVRHRWFRRGLVTTSLRVRFSHPLWRELPEVVRDVHDVSFGGLSFRTTDVETMAFPGLGVPTLEITTEHGQTIRMSGQVRTITRESEGGPALCGMSVKPHEHADELAWTRLVSEMLYPTTRTSEGLTEPLWSMFEESGYFDLGGHSAHEFAPLKSSFLEMAHRASQAPQLIFQPVWPSSRGIEASGSLLKAYQHTWMLHQLAKRPGRPPPETSDAGQIMRDLYLRGFEHPQRDPDFRWALCVVEPSVPWIRKAHLDFAANHEREGTAHVLPMRMTCARCDEPSGLRPDEVTVGPATPDELEQLAFLIQKTRPHAYVEALDFTLDRVMLAAISRSWRDAGFERERAILIARRGGAAVGAAVLETAEVGTNLFRLLDSARLFPLCEGGTVASIELIDAARRWFSARGRDAFVQICETASGGFASEEKLHDVSTPALWIIASTLVPDFLEHICELTGRRRFAT